MDINQFVIQYWDHMGEIIDAGGSSVGELVTAAYPGDLKAVFICTRPGRQYN